MTHDDISLALKINIICFLLAVIGPMVIVKHPGWFSGIPQRTGQAWEFSMPVQ